MHLLSLLTERLDPIQPALELGALEAAAASIECPPVGS
jgi:hypothetical protein